VDGAVSWARKLGGQAPLAVEEIKRVSHKGDLDDGIAAEKEGFAKVKDVPSVIYDAITFNSERRVGKPALVRAVVRDGKFTVWDGAKPQAAK